MDEATFLTADEIERSLVNRMGRVHARQRLGIERDHEAQAFGQGLTFFHLENMKTSNLLIEAALRLSGTYWRGLANAAKVRLRHNDIRSARLPLQFDGLTILHLSDLHADMSADAMAEAARLVDGLHYDLCVLTGDYRGRTFGPYQPCLRDMLGLLEALRGEVYGVMGNHDTIRMVPDLERLGVQMLLNDYALIRRGDQQIYLAGIDDAHFYRVDNIQEAAAEMLPDCSPCSCPTRPRPFGRRRMQASICSWRVTPTAARSAFPGACRSFSSRRCRDPWAEVHGSIGRWLATRRSAPARAAFPCGSTARPR